MNIFLTTFRFTHLQGNILLLFSSLFFCLAGNTTPANVYDLSEKHDIATDSINDYFVHQKTYVPGQPLNTSIKTIFLAINIWQKDDGTGNFTESEEFIEKLYWMVDVLNVRFSKTADPTHPVPGIEYLRDSHIRFELKEISFYQNSDLYGVDCGYGNRLNQFVFAASPHNRQYLNIHFNTGSCMGGVGYANYPSGRNLEEDSFIVSFMRNGTDDLENYPFWPLILHLAHELGHNLELRHPYDSEYCRFSHPDFLFDLFGYEIQSWCRNPRSNCDICYQQGGWTCDLEDPNTTCTNNLMGGNKSNGSITPLQMGRMNRSLTLRSVRKYAWGYSDISYTVSHDQQWDFNKKFYQDIHVQSGATLYITGTLEMVPEATIILEPGSALVVDGGRLTNALYSQYPWQGIVKEIPPQKRFAFLRKKTAPAEIIMINDGVIENALEF